MPKVSISSKNTIFEPPPAAGIERQFVLTPGLIIAAMWRARRLGILIVAVFVVLALLYAMFLRHPLYAANAVIEPPISAGPQLSGASQMLASFAGVEANANGAQFTKFLQVIDSTRFAERLDKDHGVLRAMNPGWNPATHSWTPPSGAFADLKARLKAMLGMRPWTPPDANSLALALQGMTTISLVPGKSPLDLRSQVFSVSVRSKSPKLSFDILDWTLRVADDLVREDQLTRTVNRIAYLRAQIDSTQEVYLRQSLQQILMSQEETLMTLQADRYYAVDIIDRPNASNIPLGTPVPTLLVMAAFLGMVLFAMIVIVLVFRRIRSPEPAVALRAPYPDPVGAAAARAGAIFRKVRTPQRVL